MKSYLALPFLFTFLAISFAQVKPTIYIDIPTEQKPWNHIEWNASPEQFQFAIVTDRTGGRRPGIFATGVEKLNLLQPEFVMSVGDLIDGYIRDTIQLNAEWKEFQGFIENLKVPFFYVPGNHDITNEVMERKWKELFGVSYYHFVYKDVLFLCLNSEDNLRGAGRGTIDDAQYEYIRKTLEENTDVKWTLV
ncbi:MAG: metallophosphoesterase, partial [Bacteroidota bacterium]